MGKALYRSYRSLSFDEVVGQDHITTTLKNALKNDAISHAYLLTGPRGVGKTSIARILAHAVNGFDYQADENHLDIIEIDAASNRRIDEVREIREKVHIAPSIGKYKVYIIDEVHMLTREAFNALLKTLEEPPAHAIFILATTDVHKVPDTIISRCIQLIFKPIEPSTIKLHLQKIAKDQKLGIDEDALQLLAQHSKGSFRDGISLLEQVSHTGSLVTKDSIEHMLGLAPGEHISMLLDCVINGDIYTLKKQLEQIYAFGVDETVLSSQLAQEARDRMLDERASKRQIDALFSLQKSLLLVPGSAHPQTELELTLYEVTLPNFTSSVPDMAPKTLKPKTVNTPPKEATLPEKKATEKHKVDTIADDQPSVAEIIVPTELIVTPPKPAGELVWDSLLNELKKKNNTLYGVARMAEASESDTGLTLRFKFAFHYKQINDSKNKAIFNKILHDLTNGDRELTLELMPKEGSKPLKPAAKPGDLETVSNIFGSHEVLES